MGEKKKKTREWVSERAQKEEKRKKKQKQTRPHKKSE